MLKINITTSMEMDIEMSRFRLAREKYHILAIK